MKLTIHRRQDHLSIGRLSAWIIGLAGFCLSLATWGGLVRPAAAVAHCSSCDSRVALSAD